MFSYMLLIENREYSLSLKWAGSKVHFQLQITRKLLGWIPENLTLHSVKSLASICNTFQEFPVVLGIYSQILPMVFKNLNDLSSIYVDSFIILCLWMLLSVTQSHGPNFSTWNLPHSTLQDSYDVVFCMKEHFEPHSHGPLTLIYQLNYHFWDVPQNWQLWTL